MSVWLSHHFHAFALAFKRLAAPLGSLLSIGVIGIAFSLPAGIYVMLENLQAFSGRFFGSAPVKPVPEAGGKQGGRGGNGITSWNRIRT